MLSHKKYDIRKIIKGVQRREKEERRVMELINHLSVNDLRDDIIGITRSVIKEIKNKE